jgi:hypothetical protein
VGGVCNGRGGGGITGAGTGGVAGNSTRATLAACGVADPPTCFAVAAAATTRAGAGFCSSGAFPFDFGLALVF